MFRKEEATTRSVPFVSPFEFVAAAAVAACALDIKVASALAVISFRFGLSLQGANKSVDELVQTPRKSGHTLEKRDLARP